MAPLTGVFAAVIVLLIAPAQAASFAAAAANDLTITLFDLRPSDGITPSITFSQPYFGDSASVNAQDGGNFRSSSAGGTGPFDLNAATARSSARATVMGTGPTDVDQLTAEGSALGPVAVGGGSSFFSANAASPSFASFTLTPGTLVSFSALATLNARTTIGGAIFGPESASASVSLSASGTGPNGTGFQSSQDSRSIFIGGPASQQAITAFPLVSFTNLSGGNLVGSFNQSVSVNGFSSVIPEPETYAIMVVGLGLLGFMLGRRGLRHT